MIKPQKREFKMDFVSLIVNRFGKENYNKLVSVCSAISELDYDWEEPRNDFAENCVMILEAVELCHQISEYVDENCDSITDWSGQPNGWDFFDAHTTNQTWKGLSVSKEILRACIMGESIKMMVSSEVDMALFKASFAAK